MDFRGREGRKRQKDGAIKVTEEHDPTGRETHCVVRGAHAFILRISSIVGIAPLTFESRDEGYMVTMSEAMCAYSNILVTVLVFFTVLGLVAEINSPTEVINQLPSLITVVVLMFNMLLVTVVAGIGVCGAPQRMRDMFKLMKILTSVDKKIEAQYSVLKERKLCAVLIAVLIIFVGLLLNNQFINTLQANADYRWAVFVNYFGFIFLCYVNLNCELQFAVTVLLVYARFKVVNKTLHRIADDVAGPDVWRIQKAKMNCLNTFGNGLIRFDAGHCPNINTNVSVSVDDILDGNGTVIVRNTVTGRPKLVLPPCEAIRHLVFLYGSLCDAVYLVDKSYGLPIMMNLISTVLALIVVPYMLVIDMVESRINIHFMMVQTLWCSTYLLRMFLVVESCHHTIDEAKKTEEIICQLMTSLPPTSMSPLKLKVFSRQLMLQTASYTPMGWCTLERPFLVSVLGTVITSLLILIQFNG